MKTSLNIRRAEKKDIKALIHNVIHMADEASQIKLCNETVLNGVSNLFEKPELGFYIVAEKDNKIIGSLIIVFEWSDWRNGVRWWIHSVYVDPDYRGKGTYDQLYAYIKNEANKSKDVIGLNLSVEKNNMRAIKAYERLGMRQTNQIIYTDDDVK